MNAIPLLNSSNESVGFIDEFRIFYALKEGTTIITARIGNVVEIITITVVNEEPRLFGIIISNETVTMGDENKDNTKIKLNFTTLD